MLHHVPPQSSKAIRYADSHPGRFPDFQLNATGGLPTPRGSDFVAGNSLVTVAGPCRILPHVRGTTGLPYYPLRPVQEPIGHPEPTIKLQKKYTPLYWNVNNRAVRVLAVQIRKSFIQVQYSDVAFGSKKQWFGGT